MTPPDALRLRRVINASGTETTLGASRVGRDVTERMVEILGRSVEMSALQAAASRLIARATGAEAGFVTNCSAAGLVIAAAAAMTGPDMGAIERLPDARGLRRRILLQRGHECNFGSTVSQMLRIAGAEVVEIGTATDCSLYQLEAALKDGDAAAAVYVVSHHTAQTGMLPLRSFAATCRSHGVPVIVDAAAEYDWPGFVADGADILLFSAQKAPAGPTAGIVAGRLDLVRACRMQDRGIGRPMKAGKEAVAGAMAAIEAWLATDAARTRTEIDARLRRAEAAIGACEGVTITRAPDPTGNPFERLALAIDPARAGTTATAVARSLSAGEPSIRVRDLEREQGRLLVDVRRLDESEIDEVAARLRLALAEPAGAGAQDEPFGDEALAAYLAWPPAP